MTYESFNLQEQMGRLLKDFHFYSLSEHCCTSLKEWEKISQPQSISDPLCCLGENGKNGKLCSFNNFKKLLYLFCVKNPSLKKEKPAQNQTKYQISRHSYQCHSASKVRKCFIFLSFLYLNPGPNCIPIFEDEHKKPNPTPVLDFQHLVPSSKHQICYLFQCFDAFFSYFQSNPLFS